ncbi:MAG: hypothetical protein J5850_06560, partial [Clostridia bacterium]|nr:hypothetical protein [Clostridia bacterium]
GVEAVKLLLEGKSDLVVCKRQGKICTSEINYALKLDKLYKSRYAGYKKVDEEELLKEFTEEQKAEMYAFCQNKIDEMKRLYKMCDTLSK